MGRVQDESGYIVLSEHFDTSIIDTRKTVYSKISQVYAINKDLVN